MTISRSPSIVDIHWVRSGAASARSVLAALAAVQALAASLASLACAGAQAADTPVIYVPLAQPCRLLDTRIASGGPGPLSQAHGNYQFSTTDAGIESAMQNGSATGCGIPSGIAAISANLNMLDASAPGNIRAWSDDAGTTGPAAGSGVYNPSVDAPQAGQVLYNAGFSTIAVGADGGFYLAVANGQINMTINVAGYWRPLGWGVSASGNDSVALGYGTAASGSYSTSMGLVTTASAFASTAMGSATFASGNYSTALNYNTQASADYSTAMGNSTTASGIASTAMGNATTASGNYATALGSNTTANGGYSTALGNHATSNGFSGSFVYGDSSGATTQNTSVNQFTARASGGFVLLSSAVNNTAGVQLAAGASAWTTLSDRRAKDAVLEVDTRATLAKVVALPLNTWHYKTQDSKYRHMGPMAQDFYAAFHLGESETGIDTVDADGVALAAIQGLYKTFQETMREKDREIAALRSELVAQDLRVRTLEVAAGTYSKNKAEPALAPARIPVVSREQEALRTSSEVGRDD